MIVYRQDYPYAGVSNKSKALFSFTVAKTTVGSRSTAANGSDVSMSTKYTFSIEFTFVPRAPSKFFLFQRFFLSSISA